MRTFTRAQKDQGLADLSYEVEMLQWTAVSVPSRMPGCGQSALLESFLLHARNLIEFFRDPKKWDERNLYASDYVQGWPTSEARSVLELYDPDGRFDRISARLAHIGIARADKESWECAEIMGPLLELCRIFRAALLASDRREERP